MVQVCFYFQMHQPRRLRPYNVFETSHDYFDEDANQKILARVVQKCYLPATRLILDLIKRHDGRFRVSYSITGCLLDQLNTAAPEIIDLLGELAQTGCVSFLGETYYHSLAWLYSRDEFIQQVKLHSDAMMNLFGVKPNVFRNTELLYSNRLAADIKGLKQFKGILTEGVQRILKGRLPCDLYHAPGDEQMKLLLKNDALSDDVAFRFSDPSWEHFPLSVDKYVGWLKQIDTQGFPGPAQEAAPDDLKLTPASPKLCSLFLDYETFGEHQWAEKGIFDFLENLPRAILNTENNFVTVEEATQSTQKTDVYDCPQVISWADEQRDASAWVGNEMQRSAIKALYDLEQAVKAADDADLLKVWRDLGTSDHFYYMCTKYFADGQVHDYFSPYDTPYDAYINFMNVIEDLQGRLGC